MNQKWTIRFLLVLLAPFAVAQNLVFRADTIPVSPELLTVAKCVQVGLYVTSTSAQTTSWAQINATLDYLDPGGFIDGAPFVKASNFATISDGAISNPGQAISNTTGGATTCAPMHIINAATTGIGAQIGLATGDGPASLVIEVTNIAVGRIQVGTVNFAGNNFSLDPNVELLFAIIEFPLGSTLVRSDGDFLGFSGVQVNFVPDVQVPDGNIVSDGIVSRTASTQNGGVSINLGAGVTDRVGVYRASGSSFYLDVNGDNQIVAVDDRIAVMGASTDLPIIGDWNNNNVDELGLRRTNPFSRFFLDTNGDDAITLVDRRFFMGATTDISLAGDWNGDGTDEVGLFRPSSNQFFLDADNDGAITGADPTFFMGAAGDMPLVGDWNGDGTDDLGLFRPGTNFFYLDIDGSRSITVGDAVFAMGGGADIPLVGDWNGDGIDHIGLFRPANNRFFLDLNNDKRIMAGDAVFSMGAANDLPLVGKW